MRLACDQDSSLIGSKIRGEMGFYASRWPTKLKWHDILQSLVGLSFSSNAKK